MRLLWQWRVLFGVNAPWAIHGCVALAVSCAFGSDFFNSVLLQRAPFRASMHLVGHAPFPNLVFWFSVRIDAA